jgi:hypothetical protein
MKMVGLTEALFRLTITGKSPDAQNADPKNIQQNCPDLIAVTSHGMV